MISKEKIYNVRHRSTTLLERAKDDSQIATNSFRSLSPCETNNENREEKVAIVWYIKDTNKMNKDLYIIYDKNIAFLIWILIETAK